MEIAFDEDEYQVFFLGCKCPYPFKFAEHTWIVTNNKGKLNRWEVMQWKDMGGDSWGHVHKNRVPPFTAFKSFFYFGWRFKVKLLGVFKGGEESLAYRMINFIEENAPKYSFKDSYFPPPGPNSNTFTQWVIDNFPECDVELPGDAMGKNFPEDF